MKTYRVRCSRCGLTYTVYKDRLVCHNCNREIKPTPASRDIVIMDVDELFAEVEL